MQNPAGKKLYKEKKSLKAGKKRLAKRAKEVIVMLDQKGFSPVIAVVLMVAVAVAAAVIAYLWGIGLLSGIIAGSDTGQITGTAAVSIEAISSTDNNVLIRCKGDITEITDVYVTRSPGNIERFNASSTVSCTAGGTALVYLDDTKLSGGTFDVNVGHVVRVVGSNNAEAIKTA